MSNMDKKKIAAQLRAAAQKLDAGAKTKAARGKKKKPHFELSNFAEEYADQVGLLAQNNYGPWKDVKEAEAHVKKAIRDYARDRMKDVLDSFTDEDVKYIVENTLYIDDPDPYGIDKTPENAANTGKMTKLLEGELKRLLGSDVADYAGVRDDSEGLTVWIEGHPKHNVDTLWSPLTQALNRAGFDGLMQPYDDVTLIFEPA